MKPTVDEIAHWRTMFKPQYPDPHGELDRQLWYYAKISERLENELASTQDQDADQIALDQYVLSEIEKILPELPRRVHEEEG